jgi:hypothetical protein
MYLSIVVVSRSASVYLPRIRSTTTDIRVRRPDVKGTPQITRRKVRVVDGRMAENARAQA